MLQNIIKSLFATAVLAVSLNAQTTPVVVQGSLKDGNAPANGSYDVRVSFYPALDGGESFGSLTYNNVPVVNGTFSIAMDGLNTLFTSVTTNIWLEFSVKPGGSPTQFTTLAPRQIVAYAPYAMRANKAVSADNLGGTPSSEFVRTDDPRLSDARPPSAGNTNYIQNTNTQQATSNFNISGTGKANILDASQLNIGGNRMFTNNGQLGSLFAGLQSGPTTTGSANSFFGANSGNSTTSGLANSFFGWFTGGTVTTGNDNAFFGGAAGNQTTTGSNNTFVGRLAGVNNITGSSNIALGMWSGPSTASLTNATAIGTRAFVAQDNSLVLGSINGINNATADTKVGIGTTTPADKLHVNNGSIRVTNGGIYIANPNTLVITSPNGACWGITVNNSGGLSTFPVTPCP